MKLRKLLAITLFTVLPASQASAAFIVDIYQGSSSFSNLTAAEALFGSTPSHTGIFDVINMNDGQNPGSNTHFSGDSSFPGNVTANFALDAYGAFNISNAGTYTFGVRHDDGAALAINGTEILRFNSPTNDRDTFASTFLDVGLHTMDLSFFENGGGAHLELFYASGSHTSFNSQFQLLEAAVPEPSILALMGLGLVGLGFARRRKAQA